MPAAPVVSVGLSSTTFFRRRGLKWVPPLAHAYRAPMLFGQVMSDRGLADAEVFGVDERIGATDYDGTARELATHVDVLYVSAHGWLKRGVFELLLHADEWMPTRQGLGGAGPRVAVFDACDLVDLNQAGWAASWSAANCPNLRLVLGFRSPVTVTRATTLRGAELAERLGSGQGVASAWIAAVAATSGHRRDHPVALGFGSDALDADRVLQADLATVLALPPLAPAPTVRPRV